jgi:DNA-binding HxlR family transcriptional regulator
MSRRAGNSLDWSAESTLAMLHGKWKAAILCHLEERPLRYSELRALIQGLSDKVLTQRLHDLMSQGLIAHRCSATTPRGRYYLKPHGHVLLQLLKEIEQWGRTGVPRRRVSRGLPRRKSLCSSGARES